MGKFCESNMIVSNGERSRVGSSLSRGCLFYRSDRHHGFKNINSETKENEYANE